MHDREKVIKGLEPILGCAKQEKWGAWIDTLEDALALLKEQEEKTGHWIYESEFADCWSNTCSECGKRFTNAIDFFAPYCWNCGAKMEGR